ncbi:DUF5990 family protein [Streptomyces sp. NPDC007988]|uniref:DUF5990 family protein n=1 Tax=Streptomyces sp. NPDC007988 TaxID=3364802 RepID=UPI0036E65D89
MALLTLRITGRDLPGRDCGDFFDVHVGTQRGTKPDQLVPADAEEAVFDLTADVVAAPDGTADFRGPWVQGPRGARFVYLTWGELPAGGTFAMFRRAKLFLGDIPPELVAGGSAETTIGLTDGLGLPLCAAVRPPRVVWRAGRGGRTEEDGGHTEEG